MEVAEWTDKAVNHIWKVSGDDCSDFRLFYCDIAYAPESLCAATETVLFPVSRSLLPHSLSGSG